MDFKIISTIILYTVVIGTIVFIWVTKQLYFNQKVSLTLNAVIVCALYTVYTWYDVWCLI